VSTLVDKLFAVHDSLTDAGLAHAFGGAIALAFCTKEPRGTRDLDVNIFAAQTEAESALEALPDQVRVTPEDVRATLRDGQRRLWWGETPVDVFLNTHAVHEKVERGVVWVPLSGRQVPIVDCASLAVFKALLGRTKDWADLEGVAEAAPRDIEAAATTTAELVGADDPAVGRLESLLRPEAAGDDLSA
jgi:hypothetical protein